MTKVVVFDFDGVFVLDSDAVFKPEAWAEAFKEYSSDSWKPLLKEANQTFGNGKPGGRKEILAYVFQALGVNENYLPAKVATANQVFSDHVRQRIKAAGLVDGVEETLRSLQARGIKMYLNSGTATAPLKVAAEDLGVAKYLAGVLGSTPDPVGGSKVSNLEYVAQMETATPQEILMFGDGESDINAAEDFGCLFIGYANVHNGWVAEHRGHRVVKEIRELLQYLG